MSQLLPVKVWCSLGVPAAMADWDWGMKKTGKSNADSRERLSYLVLEVTFWFSLFHLCPGLNAAAKFSIYANLDVSSSLQWLATD